MSVLLNIDELEIHDIVEKKIIEYINTYIEDSLYADIYEVLAEHSFASEYNMPPGSRSIDASADRIYYYLSKRFKQ